MKGTMVIMFAVYVRGMHINLLRLEGRCKV